MPLPVSCRRHVGQHRSVDQGAVGLFGVKPVLVNKVRVYPAVFTGPQPDIFARRVEYCVPSLSVEINGTGPLAGRILHTMTLRPASSLRLLDQDLRYRPAGTP